MASLRQRMTRTPAGARARSLRRALRLSRAHSGDFESRLTWIFGSPRSGSTWLLTLLAEHRAVVPINEPLIGWYLGPFLCDLPTGDATALDGSNFTLRRVQRYNPDAFFSDHFSDVWTPGLGRIMRERFYEHARRASVNPRASDTRIVIKEPNGSQSADLIMRSLPQARMLFLLRDGRDVVDSELAGNLEGSWVTREFPGLGGLSDNERLGFAVQSAHKWLWRTEVAQQAFREHTGSKHLLRYEQLRADPETHLRVVFDWLGLPVAHHELQAWIARHAFEDLPGDVAGPEKFFRAASPGRWRESLRPEEQAAVMEVIGDKLRELGYDQ
jgi:Sulfotransferase family